MSWLADHMEYAAPVGIKYNSDTMCQTTKDELAYLILLTDMESDWQMSAVIQ